LGASEQDLVTVSLDHLANAKGGNSFKALVDTFLDVWIDPYEFECTKYSLDTLPAPLNVTLEWKSQSA
jgi:hypothetical protein